MKYNKKYGESSVVAGRQILSPEYIAWRNMRARCNSKTASQYAYYGGRGISICERWEDFNNFLQDMGRKPSSAHSIDRVDNNGPYSPENCRWATKAQQSRNSRASKLTATDVEKIRSLWNTGLYTKGAISRIYSVSDVLISMIIRKKAWIEDV